METAPMQLDFFCLTCFQLSAIFQGRSMFTCGKKRKENSPLDSNYFFSYNRSKLIFTINSI